MDYKFEKSNENLQTSILSIMQMTPKNREKFYASEAGRDIVKGLFLEAENDKKAMANGMNWTQEDIEATIIALRAASEDDFKTFLQLLPGPVQTKITEHFKFERQNNGIEPNVIEKGAKIGTAGYETWLAKKRAHNPGKKVEVKVAPKVNPKMNKPAAIETPKPKAYGKFLKKKSVKK